MVDYKRRYTDDISGKIMIAIACVVGWLFGALSIIVLITIGG